MKPKPKERIVRDYSFGQCPVEILWKHISTTAGLAVWFADQVEESEDRWLFRWDETLQAARKVSQRMMEKIKFRWEEDNTDHRVYFELSILSDDVTGNISLQVTDFAPSEDVADSVALWEKQISKLHRVLCV